MFCKDLMESNLTNSTIDIDLSDRADYVPVIVDEAFPLDMPPLEV